MKEVKVTELRQNLPAYLARVGRGETFRITSRGKAIGEISPPTLSAGAAQATRERLRGSVVRFDQPLDPIVEPGDWEMDR